MLKCKSSPNLEYTCKIVVSTTICNHIYSSTRNDQHIRNNQMDAHDSCSCRDYCKAFLNDEENDKIIMITSLDCKMRL